MIRTPLLAPLALTLALTLASASHAATYTFTGSFDAAPATAVLSGSFSFDDDVVTAGSPDGSFNFTALAVSFQGASFALVQATDPYVQFESGTLTGPNALFTTGAGQQLALQSFFGSSNFTYAVNGQPDQLGTLTLTAVPEPQTWALMLGGLGAVGLIARRRRD